MKRKRYKTASAAERGEQLVRVPRDLAGLATLVAKRRGWTVAQVLDPILRPALTAAAKEECRKQLKELGSDS